MKNEPLSDRMKRYEASTKVLLPRRTYTIIRVDGKAFHTYTKGMKRPYDDDFIYCMNSAALELCREIQGAVLGYVQSDEISICLADVGRVGQEAWFDGNLQKQVSVSASITTAAFNAARSMFDGLMDKDMALFDSRVFTIPDPIEVANCFTWRQKDCIRNSVSSVAQSHFSHKQLHGKKTAEMKSMLEEIGDPWEDYPIGCKQGRVILKTTKKEPISFVRKDTGKQETKEATRNLWKVSAAPLFTEQPEFLSGLIAATQDTNKTR